MEEQNLQEMLIRLRQELELAQVNDLQTQKLLRELDAQIKQQIEADDDEKAGSLLQRLEEAATELEASHSTLTAAITHVMTALSNMGL